MIRRCGRRGGSRRSIPVRRYDPAGVGRGQRGAGDERLYRRRATTCAYHIHHAVGLRAVVLFGPQHADPRARPEVVRRAHDAVDRVVAERRRLLVVDRRERADLMYSSDLAGELARRRPVARSAGCRSVRRRVELFGAVEKERPLLGIADRLPRVETELRHVALDLGEIRVRRGVQRQVRRDAVAQVTADLRGRRPNSPGRAGPAGALRSTRDVAVGTMSSTCPALRSVSPSRRPDCARNDDAASRTGVQVCSWPDRCTGAPTLNPQDWVRRAWKRMLLNGIRISTSYPSAVRRPFDSQTKSCDRSGCCRV